ncbi:hypothetical protein Tcan_17130 [Toxocara canis]|uniref:Uncharacterized protein n=1 Tax=Toxocara canis TaxID=6265 RepID=A0A0B2UPA7_TOXCA|nr:hypothetical protein Tcan_17130 [Toxocara canis]
MEFYESVNVCLPHAISFGDWTSVSERTSPPHALPTDTPANTMGSSGMHLCITALEVGETG